MSEKKKAAKPPKFSRNPLYRLVQFVAEAEEFHSRLAVRPDEAAYDPGVQMQLNATGIRRDTARQALACCLEAEVAKLLHGLLPANVAPCRVPPEQAARIALASAQFEGDGEDSWLRWVRGEALACVVKCDT